MLKEKQTIIYKALQTKYLNIEQYVRTKTGDELMCSGRVSSSCPTQFSLLMYPIKDIFESVCSVVCYSQNG